MLSEAVVRDLLGKLLLGGHAHMPFEEAVQNFPPEHYNTRAPNATYTIWQLVEHIRFCQWDILRYFAETATYEAPPFPDGYWASPDQQADQAMWTATIEGFLADRQRLLDLIQNPENNLTAPLPDGLQGDSMLRQIFSIAAHNAYHIGELGSLRQTLDLWGQR